MIGQTTHRPYSTSFVASNGRRVRISTVQQLAKPGIWRIRIIFACYSLPMPAQLFRVHRLEGKSPQDGLGHCQQAWTALLKKIMADLERFGVRSITSKTLR